MKARKSSPHPLGARWATSVEILAADGPLQPPYGMIEHEIPETSTRIEILGHSPGARPRGGAMRASGRWSFSRIGYETQVTCVLQSSMGPQPVLYVSGNH